MSKSRDTLQQYFDDLLSDIAEGDKLLDTNILEGSKVQESNALLTGSVLPVKKVTSALPQRLSEKMESNLTIRTSPKPQKADFAQVSVAEVQFALEEEKKRQLQHLLMPETISVDVIPSIVEKKIIERTVSIAEVDPVSHVVSEACSTKGSPLESTTIEGEPNSTVNLSRLDELLEWGDNGRPIWAQKKFDALLFQVSGLTLAVPLIALGQIVNMTDELTPLFGQSEWFMGILPTSIGKLRTINTALFVMPERYNPAFVETAKYVISLDGQPWGLAVDSVTQPISLDPDEVKWRGERSLRPWLAGTVKSSMCALIDIPQMARLLNSNDKSVSR